jgi:hypothetical protein
MGSQRQRGCAGQRCGLIAHSWRAEARGEQPALTLGEVPEQLGLADLLERQ